MNIAIWIIAICEIARVVEVAIDICRMRNDAELRKAAYESIIEASNEVME